MGMNRLGAAAVAALSLLYAETGDAASPLAGEAFSDPSLTTPVPTEWETRPLRYEPWAAGADLAVTLDQHLYQALLPAIREFARENNLTIAATEGSCGISAGKLLEKHVDMGGFCCAPGPEDRLPGLAYVTLGIGSIALLVNRANPLENIGLAQARAVFGGRIAAWGELTGRSQKPPAFIRPVARLHCKRRPGHWRLLLDNEDLFSPRVMEVNSIPDMLAAVSNDSRAIGYEVLWMVEHQKAREQVKALSLNGVPANDRAALAAGRYPLYRAFNVAVWSGPLEKPQARALAAHLKTATEALDHRYGIVPAADLRRAGWQFKGEELVGEP